MRKALLAVGAVFFAGVVALAITFMPEKLQVPALADSALPKASPPDGMTMSVLPTGFMHSKAGFSFRGGSIREARDFGMAPVLVRHPKGDLLFDTGFGRDVDEHAKRLPWLMRANTTYTKGKPAADRLAQSGYDVKKLSGLVLSHAHWDHVSGVPDFPGVPVWVTGAERAFIGGSSDSSAIARSFTSTKYSIYDFEGGPYLGFPKSHDVWGDGSIVIVPAPGHTPGSVVVFVTLPSGKRFALLGDLVWQSEGVEIPAERPWLLQHLVDVDPAAVRENIGRVAAIHARFPEVRMFPAHDVRVAAAIPVFPDAMH
jgi:glyoxylase-like metal-dependent hydrolase (beta-lactamase superfamily II)